MQTSLRCDVPGVPIRDERSHEYWEAYCSTSLRELPFEVVNRRENDFRAEDVLFDHLNCFRLLAAVRASLNVRYTHCT